MQHRDTTNCFAWSGGWQQAAAASLLAIMLAGCGSKAPSANIANTPPSNAPQANATPADDSGATAPSPLLDPQMDQAQSTSGQIAANDLAPITARITASLPDHIAVIVRDPLPVARAVLIDPRGHAVEAAHIDHDRIAYRGGSIGWPRIGVGVTGGSNSGISTGIGIGFPLLPQTTEAAGSINESRFGFVIPDIAGYNATWQHWKLHVDLSDGVNSRSFETLPPAPPPN